MPGAQLGAAPYGAGPAPAGQPPPGHRPPQGGGSHWVRNILAGIGAVVVIGIVVSVLSHTSSGGSSSTAPAGSPSSAVCTTNACIASDAEGLKGTVAKDNSVMTKVTCRTSTVNQVVSGTYTVNCTVTYSDGSVWNGIASVLTVSGDIDWEPTSMVTAGNSGD